MHVCVANTHQESNLSISHTLSRILEEIVWFFTFDIYNHYILSLSVGMTRSDWSGQLNMVRVKGFWQYNLGPKSL